MTGNWQFATVTNGRRRYSFSALKNMWADRTMCLRPNAWSKRVIRLLLRFSARQLSFADASVVILSRFICLDKRQSKYKAGIRFQSGIATTFLNVSPTPIVFTNQYFCMSISILITLYQNTESYLQRWHWVCSSLLQPIATPPPPPIFSLHDR